VTGSSPDLRPGDVTVNEGQQPGPGDLVCFPDPASGRPVWGRVTEVAEGGLLVDYGSVRTEVWLGLPGLVAWKHPATRDAGDEERTRQDLFTRRMDLSLHSDRMWW